jgi:23S rRNA (adenine2503-C2)-methyltransferase
MQDKKDIRALTKTQIQDFFIANGDKTFRANQVFDWLWHKKANNFEMMTNLSKSTRNLLENHFIINQIKNIHLIIIINNKVKKIYST